MQVFFKVNISAAEEAIDYTGHALGKYQFKQEASEIYIAEARASK